MPRHKDLKRLVRARMKKTGEAYTSALAHILRKPRRPRSAGAAAPPRASGVGRSPAGSPDYAAVAGMRDDAVKAKTGRSWEDWVAVLDRRGAASLAHRDIARLVADTFRIDGWWAQAVTVGYERIKGLRSRGQRRDGTYEASKSRTFDVPVATLFAGWLDPAVRQQWMDGAPMKVRTAIAPKSMRIGWSDGTIVAAWFTAKGDSKSVVVVQHTKLSDRDTATRLKRYWSERLEALDDVLARQRGGRS